MPESSAPNASPPAGDATVHPVARRKKKGAPAARMQLNLTAMLDVIFLLLIYFVITANFVLDEGVLTARMPRGTGEAPQDQIEPPPQRLEIELIPVDDYRVNINVAGADRITTFTQLAEVLVGLQYDPERGLQGVYPPDNPVVIKPGGDVRWQHVVNAFSAAIKARYSNVAFSQAQ